MRNRLLTLAGVSMALAILAVTLIVHMAALRAGAQYHDGIAVLYRQAHVTWGAVSHVTWGAVRPAFTLWG